jgi:putative solute:sodium symporter small subunit
MDNPGQAQARQDQAPLSCWRKTRTIVAWLLAAWAAVGFIVLFFARELSAFSFFGWPFSLYMAAQGLILFYVLLLAVYSYAMRLVERSARRQS